MNPIPSDNGFNAILAKAVAGTPPTASDLQVLLDTRDRERINALFQAARLLRQRHFDDRVFLYGFVYASTFCRNDCTFCFYRKSNPLAPRYRKNSDDIVKSARRLKRAGVHLIDFTLGEDPDLHRNDGRGIARLLDLIHRIKNTVDLPVMVSPGVVPDSALGQMADMGVAWYACYQETHSPGLFRKLRVGQSYEQRMAKKRFARRLGMLIEEGILCGIGESDDDIVASLQAIRDLKADQVRAMTFVPQQGTPMEHYQAPDFLRETLLIAVMRLVFPDRLIPASLDVEGLGGLQRRLAAGANVITSLIPPDQGLAGVAQGVLDIDNAKRTVSGIRPVIEACGLTIASAADYRRWIEARPKARRQRPLEKSIACARR